MQKTGLETLASSLESTPLHCHYLDPEEDPSPCKELDLEYITFREVILHAPFYVGLSRGDRVRLGKWWQQMGEQVYDYCWKEKRNKYAKLLYFMVQCGTLREPFTRFPGQGELPRLTNYHLNDLINQVERVIDQDQAKGNRCSHSKKQRQKIAKQEERHASHEKIIILQKSIKRSENEAQSSALNHHHHLAFASRKGQLHQAASQTEISCFFDTLIEKCEAGECRLAKSLKKKATSNLKKYVSKVRLPEVYPRKREEYQNRKFENLKTELSRPKLQEYCQFHYELSQGRISREKSRRKLQVIKESHNFQPKVTGFECPEGPDDQTQSSMATAVDQLSQGSHILSPYKTHYFEAVSSFIHAK